MEAIETEDVPDMIYNVRHSLRETQEDFGKRFGVKPAAVSKWEQGVTIPPYPTLLAIQKMQK